MRRVIVLFASILAIAPWLIAATGQGYYRFPAIHG